jgi:hypothetical protein
MNRLSLLVLVALAFLLCAPSPKPSPTIPNVTPAMTGGKLGGLHKDIAAEQQGHPANPTIPINPENAAKGHADETGNEAQNGATVVIPPDRSLDYYTGALVIVGLIQAWILGATLMREGRVERPWIMAIPTGEIGIEVRPNMARVITCSITFRNCGRNPGWLIDGAVRQAKTVKLPRHPDYTGANEAYSLTPLAPAMARVDQPRSFVLSEADYNAWLKKELILAVFGYVRYKNAANKRKTRITRFCLLCDPPLGDRSTRLIYSGPASYNRYK